MEHRDPSTARADADVVATAEPTDADAPRAATRDPASGGRLVGVDIARSLAIFGMFTVHTGVAFLAGDANELVYELTRGRSSILFAFLAGISLAIISGRAEPKTGAEGRRTLWKVAARALILLLVGSVLTTLDSGVSVILNYYGCFFLLALPFLRLRARGLAIAAAVAALAGPQLSFALRWGFEYGPLPWAWLDTARAVDPVAALSGEGFTDFLLLGTYPALTFLAFLLAGMAVGRLDLGSAQVRFTLLGAGGLLALLGYGLSSYALHGGGILARLAAGPSASPYPMPEGTEVEESLGRWHGTVPADDPGWLFVATPHSGTTFEILGSAGTALAVLALCLFLGDRLRWALYPLAAVGSMPFTVYTLHVVILAVMNEPASPLGFIDAVPEFFLIGTLLFATAWRLTLGRGPLERAVAAASNAAADAFTRPAPPEESSRR
ncbi:heparan-alpha-glucosaminide N-acetyltransferase domain-containing protein [Allonocardiopsis opalescens]|uniref:Uncharacterized protein DUF1624 n=1 Tax=Allonocardiopsis opalescens TaxID=1144618 RepID=A0A2T0PV84_9ACTN|nr:heparan-alpha-glucosaminide N-acetyltransferase domain-containing protein [Allonocardiopsis opalescens]PRX95439.1 uncharacterized protein DUF1624 [Allonocardiopsis opalescens]